MGCHRQQSGCPNCAHSSDFHKVLPSNEHDDIGQYRASDWDPSEAAHTLCMSARRRWESLSPMVDDITALVVDLQKVAGLCRLR